VAETVEGRRPVEGRASCNACPGHSTGTSMSPKRRAQGSELHGHPIPRMPITFDPRREPDAGKAHVRICAGGEEQSSSLPRPLHQEGHRARARPVERPTTGYVAPVPPRTVSDMIANSFRSHHITPPTTITLVFSMGQSARFLNDSRPTPVVHSSETLMRKKHPKTTTAERLEHLLRAFALQRLQRGSPPTAKPKAKRSKKR